MAADTLLFCSLVLLLVSTTLAGLPDDLFLPDNNDGTELTINDANEKHSMDTGHLEIQHARFKCEWCESEEECADSSVKLCHNALYCWKATVRENNILRHSRGCTNKELHYQFTCRSSDNVHRKRHAGQFNITCCTGDLCNNGTFPELPIDTDIIPLVASSWKLWSAVIVSILAVAVLITIVMLFLKKTHRSVTASGGKGSYLPTHLYTLHSYHHPSDEGSWTGSTGVKAVAAGDSTLCQYLEHSVTSGSGSGLPLMVQRTLSKQINLINCVGKGRYGEVWRGSWNSDYVAVKIFFSRDEASWRRETEMYATPLLRHSNILAYIGSDMTSRNSCTQLWLITHYHPLGSLYDHLNRGNVSKQQMMLIAISIISGLLHLHMEIHGTQGKPAIAHRDMKTKNILVKNNGECAIADFGLAVSRERITGRAEMADNPRQGTKRYMAPEQLDQSINMERWESFRACDMYSTALVLWECLRGVSEPYRIPYHDLVTSDPSFNDMYELVCVKSVRPEPCLHWNNDPTMQGVWRLMKECWSARPDSRLPALRVKKTLLTLAERDPDIDHTLLII